MSEHDQTNPPSSLKAGEHDESFEPLMQKIVERDLWKPARSRKSRFEGFGTGLQTSVQIGSLWTELIGTITFHPLSNGVLAKWILRFVEHDAAHKSYLLRRIDSVIAQYSRIRDDFKRQSRGLPDLKPVRKYLDAGIASLKLLRALLRGESKRLDHKGTIALLSFEIEAEEAWNVMSSSNRWLAIPKVGRQIVAASLGHSRKKEKLTIEDVSTSPPSANVKSDDQASQSGTQV